MRVRLTKRLITSMLVAKHNQLERNGAIGWNEREATSPVSAPCHFFPTEMDKGLKGRKVVGILLLGPDP